MQLEKWQTNVIFEAVKAGGLDPRECTFDYDDAGARITHVPSASYFLLEGDINQYTAKAVVGGSQRWPLASIHRCGGWGLSGLGSEMTP